MAQYPGDINSTDSFLSTQASWNQIAVYNGTSDDVISLQIKGKKMKVYLTAQPLSLETSLKCQIYGSSGATSGDDLTWKGGYMSPKTMSLQHQPVREITLLTFISLIFLLILCSRLCRYLIIINPLVTVFKFKTGPNPRAQYSLYLIFHLPITRKK